MGFVACFGESMYVACYAKHTHEALWGPDLWPAFIQCKLLKILAVAVLTAPQPNHVNCVLQCSTWLLPGIIWHVQ